VELPGYMQLVPNPRSSTQKIGPFKKCLLYLTEVPEDGWTDSSVTCTVDLLNETLHSLRKINRRM